MFAYAHSVSGRTTARRVWSLYSDVSCWHLWDTGIAFVDLSDGFAVSSRGVMNMADGAAFPFSITECDENKRFVTKSCLGDLVVSFGHEIEESDGLVTLTHTVTVEGGTDEQAERMGKRISAGVPECMQRLIAL